MNKPRKPKDRINILFKDGTSIIQFHRIVHTYKTVDGVTYGNLKDGRRVRKVNGKWYYKPF